MRIELKTSSKTSRTIVSRLFLFYRFDFPFNPSISRHAGSLTPRDGPPTRLSRRTPSSPFPFNRRRMCI